MAAFLPFLPYLAACPLGDVLLIQDYGKGVCTKRLLRSLIAWAREANIPVLVDPARGRDWCDYEGCTLIKANRVEAAEALGVQTSGAPAMMARRLAIRHGCKAVVTAGELGLWWSNGDRVSRVPAIPVGVRDVCGAGDTVLATLGVGVAENEAIEGSCRLAVNTASQQVASTGVTAFWWSLHVPLGRTPEDTRVDVARAPSLAAVLARLTEDTPSSRT